MCTPDAFQNLRSRIGAAIIDQQKSRFGGLFEERVKGGCVEPMLLIVAWNNYGGIGHENGGPAPSRSLAQNGDQTNAYREAGSAPPSKEIPKTL